MTSFVPGPSWSNRVSDIEIVRALPSPIILPIPCYVASRPRQLLRAVNWGPRFKHYVHIPRRSINHWLSVEILAYIFLYIVESSQIIPYQLVSVCRRWRNVINSMANLWSTLRLGTWTEIENVHIWLERSKEGPLVVSIDPQRDAKRPISSLPYAGLQYAFKSVDRWQDLVITSFTTAAVFDGAVDFQTAKPMGHLKSLEVGYRCQDSATLTLLLDHISKTAVLLSHMSLLGATAVFSFLQPQRHRVLNLVTTLIVDGKDISRPVPILHLLVRLQTLEASHLPLPNYDVRTILPFLSTLRTLKLRAVPIQWMEGRTFKRLEDCTIVHAIGQGGIQQRINLPCCRALIYQGHPMITLQHFNAPQVKEMVLNSHDTRRERVQQHLEHLCMVDGKISQLHTLHLTIQCSEKALVTVMKYMWSLQKLILIIAHSSPSWQEFLESLATKPFTSDWPQWNIFNDSHPEWNQWCSSRYQCANILPSLKYLGIQSPKGFSSSQCLENLPLLRFVAWTRAQSYRPLEELKVWEDREITDDIVVDYTSTGYLDKHIGTSREEYDWRVVRGMATKHLVIHYNDAPLFKKLHSTILFRQLQALVLRDLPDETHVLPFLQQIKTLEIWNSTIPAYSSDIDLPLIHTLQHLELTQSTFSWMLGRSFTALKECFLSYPEGKCEDLSGCKGLQVDMPACTTMKWWGSLATSFLFFCPNVQVLGVCPEGDPEGHGVTIEEAVFKPLDNFISSCSCLQHLEITLNHCLQLDSLILLVFRGAWEQGIWHDIKSVEVNVLFDEVLGGSDNERDHFFSQTVGHRQHYKEHWAEFTVTKRTVRVILTASM
jgi:hypothetical protein